MQAPVEILRHSGEQLQPYLRSPASFFWATGILSSFLDNAPTYVVFLETAAAMSHESTGELVTLLGGRVVTQPELVAISIGAVFMGANTYIGNGPNFMVRSIAEQSGIRMPSFFGYMLYSGVILLPLFLVITLLFL
jgi:Na+/H+ antiporter NhaD/arsenite permease-like protein